LEQKTSNLKNSLHILYNKGSKSKALKLCITLFFASLTSFLVAREIFFKILVFGDSPLVTINSGPVIGEYMLNNWHRASYGENYPSPFAHLFLYIFNEMASYIGTIDVFSLMMNLSIPLAFLAFYSFSRKFCQNMWLRIFGATVYIINPVSLAFHDFGMWPNVFLPLSLSFFIDLLEKQTLKNLAKAIAFTNLTVWTYPTLSPILFFTLFTTALGYLTLAPSKSKFLRGTSEKLLLFALITIICNASFIFAQGIYYRSPLYGYEAESIVKDFKYTYQQATIFNLLRLAGNIGSPQAILGYNDTLNVINEIGIIIPIMALGSVFWVKKSPKKNRLVAMLTSIGFISILVLLLRSLIYSEQSGIIQSIPILWTLRNPFKLQLVLAVCIIPLFIFTTEKVAIASIHFLRKRNFKPAVLAFALIGLSISHIYLYNSFAFSGYMGLDKVYGASQTYLPDKTLERIVNNSMNWFSSGTYRGIVLPFDHRTELHVQFTNPLLYPGRLGLTSTIIDGISDALDVGPRLVNLLSLLSTKYVYVNFAWKNTDFQIIQPENIQRLAENLRNENLTEENNGEYSKFVIETSLPRAYVSTYPVFYSNIETIGLLNKSIFDYEPVFLEIENSELNATYSVNSMIFNSYLWENPFQGIYDAYSVVYSNKQELPIYYSLDQGELINTTEIVAVNSLRRFATFELNAGNHKLSLAAERTPFSNLAKDFDGEGQWNIEENLIRIENGKLLTSQIYDALDLSLEFKPVMFGEDSWNGPVIHLNYNDSSYLRIIFHKDGHLEVAKAVSGQYYGGIATKETNVTIDSWNNLRVFKTGETLELHLNGEPLLTLTDPSINNIGKIGIGSDGNSITCFRDVTVSEGILAGIWLFPAEQPEKIQTTIIDSNPEEYRLQFNQTRNSWATVFLGENYEPNWEATMDGVALTEHSIANTYANCWFINATEGIHEITINYVPNTMYQYLLYLSITSLGFLLVVPYLPTSLLVEFRSLLRRVLYRKKTETV